MERTPTVRVVSSSRRTPQRLELVNLHLVVVLPGAALSGTFLAEHLERDRSRALTDDRSRSGRCCRVRRGQARRPRAPAPLRGSYRGMVTASRGGRDDWFVPLSDRDAAAELLRTPRGCLEDWGVTIVRVAGRTTHVPMIRVPTPGRTSRRPSTPLVKTDATGEGTAKRSPAAARRLPTVESPEPGLTVGGRPVVGTGSALAGGEEVGVARSWPT